MIIYRCVIQNIICVNVYTKHVISVRVDEELKEKMNRHPEINWSEYIREEIQNKINQLDAREATQIMDSIAEKAGEWDGEEEIIRWRRRDEP